MRSAQGFTGARIAADLAWGMNASDVGFCRS
jgi:hypothetical protein